MSFLTQILKSLYCNNCYSAIPQHPTLAPLPPLSTAHNVCLPFHKISGPKSHCRFPRSLQRCRWSVVASLVHYKEVLGRKSAKISKLAAHHATASPLLATVPRRARRLRRGPRQDSSSHAGGDGADWGLG